MTVTRSVQKLRIGDGDWIDITDMPIEFQISDDQAERFTAVLPGTYELSATMRFQRDQTYSQILRIFGIPPRLMWPAGQRALMRKLHHDYRMRLKARKRRKR